MGEICFIDLPSLVLLYKAVSLRVEDDKAFLVLSPKDHKQEKFFRLSTTRTSQLLSQANVIGYLKLRWQVSCTKVLFGQGRYPGGIKVEFDLVGDDRTPVVVRPLRVWIGSESKEETMVLEG